MCVCVKERERERARERSADSADITASFSKILSVNFQFQMMPFLTLNDLTHLNKIHVAVYSLRVDGV